MGRELLSAIAVAASTAPINALADTVGTEVDLQGFEAVVFVGVAGVLTGGGFDFLIEESDVSGSGFTAVADADLLPSGTGQEAARGWAATDDGEARKIGYSGSKRFVRATLVETGTLTVGLICLIALRFKASLTPVSVDVVK